ncbi:hypothetical protein A3B32_02485 [Candidatus Uhrbacteria bacterium RIFCSPLOWO2_01_FULL_53_9]|uniref:Cation-transporting P-type ATPase N-terminal domain-containing protein n=1 Tax=Candidatus Uhrbacteria bacterium RIFCSPLOWO2_01_FULL_53_9 TaxID=1802403 RepID=A0A1F7UYH7_9BACT|nr:MAG: hypothetical protein A3B32_02485 [Candidatus Uhrbacteria bacterium RIFCSPLOWO2_01_FULL_53_9]
MQQAYHNLSVADVLARLNVSEDGLLADEVRVRLQQEGRNEMPSGKQMSSFSIFFRQVTSPLMLVLVVATAISLLIGEWQDSVIILVAILINAIVGFIQEFKAERAVRALQTYEVHSATVRRGGTVQRIETSDLVSGDIVLLHAGARIPADMRVLHTAQAQVDEAILTGESFPVEKQSGVLSRDVALGDRTNMVFKGTTLVDGKIEGVVVATGSRTRIGLISTLVQETQDEPTPLQQQLKRFGRVLGAIVLVLAVALYIAGRVLGYDATQMLKVSVALSVAAIPEGLLVALTVILAVGMQRMLRRKALVRKLVAAETLGSVTVVCTDKTGTLTEGRMHVARVVTATHDVALEGRIPDDVYDVCAALALNNDASMERTGAVGHPTEVALLEGAQKARMDVRALRRKYPRRAEVPFRSSSKYMATLHGDRGSSRLIVKGAPEAVFAFCQDTKGLERKVIEMASSGLRVLAVAVKDNATDVHDRKLTCLGLVGLSDPVRAQAETTIVRLADAGVRVVMITGDHPETVQYVARQVGLSTDPKRMLTGRELERLSDEELRTQVARIDIYARVEPAHKVRIVNALRSTGAVVAMVGDGVNDAAALKAAYIGVAVAVATDVTKETSEMVLLDNNLSSIAAAVHEGRIIFDNIRKVVVYLMADSFSEIVLVAGSLFMGIPIPITAAQILWINIVSDGFPLAALTMEPGEAGVMHEMPRRRDEPVMSREMQVLIFLIGIVTDVGLFVLYLFLLSGSDQLTAHLQTIMFTALAMDSLLFAFAVRSFRVSIFRLNPLRNRWLLLGVGAGVLIQIAAVYVPALQTLFGTVALNLFDWVLIGALAVVKLVGIELMKDVLSYQRRRRAQEKTSYAPSH